MAARSHPAFDRSTLGYRFPSVVGASALLLDALQQADQAAPTPYPILITGETGTGKTLLASEIHTASGRRGSFVTLNCAALPATLVESELFGYEKGSFTGADRSSAGLFEQADNGTLFLDEIGDLALDAQAKLLRTIETGLVRRLGGAREVAINVRLIGATHRDLPARIREGAFRQDLYYRINSFIVDLPPLRSRPGDLAALVAQLIGRDATAAGVTVDDQALAGLASRDWPGNLRELQSVIRQAVLRARSSGRDVVTADDLPLPDESDPEGSAQAPSGDPAIDRSPSPSARGSAVASESDLVAALRHVRATGDHDVAAWAHFLVQLARDSGSTVFSRASVVDVLREMRDDSTSEHKLNHEWRELRAALLATGLLAETGIRMRLDRDQCDRVLAESPVRIGTNDDESPAEAGAPKPEPRERPATPPPAATSAPAAAPPPTTPGNLPATRTPLVGRSADLDAITSALGSGERLVTIVGPAGVGKTSLALAVARDASASFPGGAWFVDLSSATDRESMVQTVGATLGLPVPGVEPEQAIGRNFASRTAPTLVVLDNLEQLTADLPATLGLWLDSSTALSVIATSREPVRVSGEVLHELSPLDVEATGPDGSVELFLARARAVRPGFEPSGDDPETIRRICQKLSGLPLAVELAAARVRVLSPTQIAERLDRTFDLLRADRPPGRGPAHHSALSDTLAWGFELLSPAEQAAFLALQVFRGGFTLDAAEAVLGDLPDGVLVLDAVTGLLDRSMLRRVEGGLSPRFDTYVVMREFARRVADNHPHRPDMAALERRLGDWVIDALSPSYWLLQSDRSRSDEAITHLRAERDNLGHAFECAIRRGEVDERVADLASLDFTLSFETGVLRGLEDRLRAALPLVPESSAMWCDVRTTMAQAMVNSRLALDTAEVHRLLDDCETWLESHADALSEKRAGGIRAAVLGARSRTLVVDGRYDEAARASLDAAARHEQRGQHLRVARALFDAAMARLEDQQLDDADRLFARAQTIAEIAGDRMRVRECLGVRGKLLLRRGNPDDLPAARRYLGQAFEGSPADLRGRANHGNQLVELLVRMHEVDDALRVSAEAMVAAETIHHTEIFVRIGVNRLAALEAAGDDEAILAEAPPLLARCWQHNATFDVPLLEWYRCRALRRTGDHSRAQAILAETLAAHPGHAYRCPLLLELADLAREGGQPDVAARYLQDALAAAAELPPHPTPAIATCTDLSDHLTHALADPA